MDGNEDLKSYFAEKSRAESQTHWQTYKGYLDGPILMLAFIVCVLLWMYSLYFLPVVVRSSQLVPWRVGLALFWFICTLIVASRTRPNGSNGWRRAYQGELFPNLKGASAVVVTVAVVCVWCAACGLPGAIIAAIPASVFGADGGSMQLSVAKVSVWAPHNRNTGKLMITTDGPAYSGSFLWDRYDLALRAFDEVGPSSISCLSIDYRKWLGIAVINGIHSCR
ncbi:hypothetical protein [Dyella mobilis]|uniref:Uncharacterized protein n=1 Tax=Dyella mobilis TaxID=1849582 RepID=A0ABS2KJP4_9GAMM|nr:hypothetical protein [Dyella mobilis]MBM7131140.1 hypothetical protein [Dyella mobilis]GLQ98926.1 hypothetical protein GCM10007863_33460 [Dyella mobilis]